MRTRATCAHSRTTSPRFSAWCLLVNFCSTFGVPSVYSQAITRVVAASGGKLNWDVRKDVSSWNCVTVAGAGANFSVKFGFKFSSPVDLADLVQIFGAKLASLDVANQPKLKGGSFDAWGCRGITGKFLGSLFREKSYESFRENSLGDIAVLGLPKLRGSRPLKGTALRAGPRWLHPS